jgi:uncharacterized membrane protein SpoIIM required for sporulation/uncharacterized RDD family membrane protein YckC
MTTAAPASHSFEQQIEIETPEQVIFSYTVAGVGSRAAAALIDYLLMFAGFAMIAILWMVVSPLLHIKDDTFSKLLGAWATALLILALFAVQVGYFIVFEAIWDGQTPGKRQLGIRVVQDGGFSVSIGASAVRNVMRILDMQPGLVYAVGIASAALSKSGKRLGDFLAGTIVVQEKVVHIAPVITELTPAAQGAALVSAALSDREYEVLERYLARRGALAPERRRAIAEQLMARFKPHLDPAEGSPFSQLNHLFEIERAARARGVAARGATGAARERHAIVARNAGRWSAFASQLAEAQRTGLRSMSENDVSAFVASYREVATDLARLRTASAGQDTDAMFYVSRLVGAGHNLIYRQRRLSTQNAARYLLVTVPREVRRSWRPILLAAFLFFGSMAATTIVVLQHPSVAEDLLPPGMLDRVAEGEARERAGHHEYIKVKDFERPLMASAIIANNVQVTLMVWAAGITAGILTILMLLTNGVSIGAVIGLYANHGILRQLALFVIPHSVLELSAISIAAGGGFLIASAIVLPGPYTRREAFVIKGRRAIRLLAATTMMLMVAGTIEGLLSPRVDVPDWLKFGVASASAALLLYYFSRGTGDEEEAPREESAYSEARALISR